jgi:hypothetical protein
MESTDRMGPMPRLLLALALAACTPQTEPAAASAVATERTEAPLPAPPVPAAPAVTTPVVDQPAATVDDAEDEDDGDEDDDDDDDSCEGAYRAIVSDFNDSDANEYFAGFVDPLVCFHGRRDEPLAALRASRGRAIDAEHRRAGLFVASLEVLRASEDECVLLDRGAFWGHGAEGDAYPHMRGSSDAFVGGIHEKVIVMRRVDGTWRIAAETDRAHVDCLTPTVVLPPASAELEACRTRNTSCLNECEGACGRCGACNECNLCPGECLEALADCVGADMDEDFLPEL